MDEQIIGYALKALPAAEMAEVEQQLATDPEAAAKLACLRKFLTTLSADAEREPPLGLAAATIGAVAKHVVDNKLPLDELVAEPSRCGRPCDPCNVHPAHDLIDASHATFEELAPVVVRSRYNVRRWFEVSLVAGIAFLSFGLMITGMMKIRHDSEVAACRQNMLALYKALSGYADTHHDQFPKIGTPATPNAGAFVAELQLARQLRPDTRAICPAAPCEDRDQISYVYTLGYMADDEIQGIRRRVENISDQLTPLLADLPTAKASPLESPLAYPTAGPFSPHGKGQNILFADGHVTYSLITTINNDDIYKNQNGRVRAGLHRLDASLGRAGDVP